jgi:hypothetical protein
MQKDKTILVTSFYIPEREDRLRELEYCIDRNNKNTLIDLIVLVVEEGTPENLIPAIKKAKIEWVSKRPTYQDLFNIALNNIEESKGFMIIANSDIFYMKEDIAKMKERIEDKDVFALSRWEFNFRKPHTHHDTWDSQDSWIFKNTILPGNYDIKLGIPGCDNKIAYELQEAGHTIKNPSKSIRSYHFHKSEYRTYVEEDRIEEPYLFINTEE